MGFVMTDDLFSSLPAHLQACQSCFDTGLIWRAVSRQIGRCEKCGHPAIITRAEVRLVLNQAEQQRQGQGDFSPLRFDLAKALTCYTSVDPCAGETLQGFVMGRGIKRVDAERYVKKSIESLRNDWLLPVASRKEKPSGYWMCRTRAELIAWSRMYCASALTALSTNHKVLKANLAALDGQESFDFMRHVLAGIDPGERAEREAA